MGSKARKQKKHGHVPPFKDHTYLGFLFESSLTRELDYVPSSFHGEWGSSQP